MSEGQAKALEAFARERRAARVSHLGREERFRLLGGFNDFFIAVGVVMLWIGLAMLPTLTPFGGATLPTPLISLVVFWWLAEYLTARKTLVAPSIVIVLALTTAAFLGAQRFNLPVLDSRGGGSPPVSPIAGYAGALAVLSLHYGRFRLPFTLFMIVGALIGLVLTLVVSGLKSAGVHSEAMATIASWVAFGLGLGVFSWAMSYDASDPERTSRRADCGFWLHLIAAPLIVHPLVSPLIAHPIFGRLNGADATNGSVALALALILALSGLALIVDRRALLVAGLGYLGAALAYTMSKLSGGDAQTFAMPILLLIGALIITLGVGWRPIRARLMSLLPGGPWRRFLPPVEGRS